MAVVDQVIHKLPSVSFWDADLMAGTFSGVVLAIIDLIFSTLPEFFFARLVKEDRCRPVSRDVIRETQTIHV